MGHKLLLADDSTTIQKVVSIIFSGDEYELTVVDNGTDALARARESLPDVMLVDAVMPGIDGYAVCRAVRDDPRLSFVPLLLLTGVFDSFDETAAVAAGADDVISKPFEAQVLIDKVTELIAIGEGRRPVPSPQTPESAEFPAGQDEPLIIEEVTDSADPWGIASAAETCPAENGSGESLRTGDEDEEFVLDLVELDVLSPPVESSDAAVPAPVDLLPPPSGEPSSPAPEEVRPPFPEELPSGASAAEFTEEQLVAALSKISREVIERIVWEVVPDLAETLIREEIRKLREGV